VTVIEDLDLAIAYDVGYTEGYQSGWTDGKHLGYWEHAAEIAREEMGLQGKEESDG
jgi:hypothetical protein